MKKLFLLILSVLLVSSVYSQQPEFSRGYVITTKGDTLIGNVKDRKIGFQDELLNKLIVKMDDGNRKKSEEEKCDRL